MLTVAKFKGEMSRREKAYEGPNDSIRANLASTDVVVLMGPSGVGKNEQKTRFVQAANLTGRLAVAEVESVTSRPRRKEERGKHGVDPYKRHYNIRSEKGQERVISLFEEGLLVQATIHPDSGHLYGTLHEDYVASPAGDSRVINLADFMAREYLRLAKKEMFRSFLGIYLAAEDTMQWLDMWKNRGDGFGSLEDINQRLSEGYESTGICTTTEAIATRGLHHVAVDFSNAIVPETGLTRTTGTILSIVNQEGTHDNAPGIFAAQSMHSFIGGMRQGLQLSGQIGSQIAA